MKLFYSLGACSLSPHIALQEAGLPVELVRVDLVTKQTSDGSDFLAINPKAYVPVLQLDDGEFLTEGPAIVQYIADLVPQSGLAPASGTMARYRLQEWLNFISSEVHKAFGPLFKRTTPDETRQTVIATLEKRFAFLDDRLRGQPFLMGETFTVADGYLFTILKWAKLGARGPGALAAARGVLGARGLASRGPGGDAGGTGDRGAEVVDCAGQWASGKAAGPGNRAHPPAARAPGPWPRSPRSPDGSVRRPW
jgi:glutathione S-transferase